MPDKATQALHDAACREGSRTYCDPNSGFQVFTEQALREREECCGAGCRHCPYHHESVAVDQRASKIQQPAWLSRHRPQPGQICCLFWSGGKDSYLAYRALTSSRTPSVVLFTTFDRASGKIAHQELPIDTVIRQANQLGVPLIGVPLHSESDYLEHIAKGLELVPGATSLAFGDLHLAHIREWRERAFSADDRTAHLKLLFPIWHRPYEALLTELMASGARCTVSAVTVDHQGIQVGDVFDSGFVARLPDQIDAFGENGEFHTEVTF